MMQRHEGWMFLSHSSKDFELVRQIRNTLEDHGFRPIAFFLKCITDSDELDGLIKREIAARRWFVFVDSEHSRSSKWAQEELAYARKLRRTVYTIDAARDYLPQLWQIIRRTTVFLSYCHQDREIASKIREALIANDFQTWWDNDLSPGARIAEEIAGQIETAGFCLLLISEHALQSEYLMQEIDYAFYKDRPVIPVLIGDIRLPPLLRFQLTHIHCAKLPASPSPSDLNKLVDDIIQYQEINDI